MEERPPLDPRIIRAFVGRFGYLLTALIALMISAPLIVDGWLWNLALDLIASAALVACIFAAMPGRRPLLLGLMAAAIDLGLGRIAGATGVQWLHPLQFALWLVTLLVVAETILEGVLRSKRVTIETLQAAICVYLLLGLIWTFLYALVDTFAPSEFGFPRGSNFRWTDIPSRRAEFMRLFFFSYSTLSAVGGGGIETAGWFIRMVACLEAMTGQIYIGVLIARLVGIHVVQSPSARP